MDEYKKLFVKLAYERLAGRVGKNFRLCVRPLYTSNLGPVVHVNGEFHAQHPGHALVQRSTLSVSNYDMHVQSGTREIANLVHLLYYIEVETERVLTAWLGTNYDGELRIDVEPVVQMTMVSENGSYSIVVSYPDLRGYFRVSGEWA
jgi:hypothetical protein